MRDGLWPRRAAHGADSFVGGELRPRLLARRFALTQTATEQWAAAVTATPGWPNHPYTPYRARAAVSVLPGQAEYGALDHRARVLFADLVVAGLEYWHEGALEITWYRFGHPRQLDERRWPSPIATFLREAAWLPISEPGQRRDESFVAPREGWFFAESRGEDPPNFSPLVAGRVRREITAGDNALVRLKQLGMGDWGEVRDAPRLLHHLAGLVENDEPPGDRTACVPASVWGRLGSLGRTRRAMVSSRGRGPAGGRVLRRGVDSPPDVGRAGGSDLSDRRRRFACCPHPRGEQPGDPKRRH